MTKQVKIPNKVLLQVAVQTGTDPRTVQRVANGQPVKGLSLARILPALRALGLVALVFALGCDGEGVSARPMQSDAGADEDPATGPNRGGGSGAFQAVDVQPVAVPPDAGTVATPDTMPTVTPDALVAVDIRPAVAVDTMPAVTGIDSLRACPAPRVFSSISVCPGKWQGDKKSFCIQGGRDADGVIYGSVVQYGDSPCSAMGVSDSVSGRAVIVVIPAGACDTFCKP